MKRGGISWFEFSPLAQLLKKPNTPDVSMAKWWLVIREEYLFLSSLCFIGNSTGLSPKQKAASKVAPHRITAQPGTGVHMAQFLVDFINECGGQTRLATLRRVALPQYQEKYHWHYTRVPQEVWLFWDFWGQFRSLSCECSWCTETITGK